MANLVRNKMTDESSCLRVQLKRGGITHPRLNMDGKPIANKYREGKMKRTLKRESKELEAVEMDAVGHTNQMIYYFNIFIYDSFNDEFEIEFNQEMGLFRQ